MRYLEKLAAEKFVRSTISKNPALVAISAHCKVEMSNDDLIVTDLMNVLKHGKVRKKGQQDSDSGDFIYRIETAKIVVVFKFKEFARGSRIDIGVKLVTCWRKGNKS